MALTTVPVELASLDGAVTVNESSADADFRVESNDSTHMLFVDAGNNRIGINDSAPQQLVDIFDSTLPVIRLTNGRNEGAGSDYDLGKIEFFSDDSSGTGARVLTEINAIADAASTAPGGIFVIKTAVTNSAAVERVRFDAGNEVVFNDTGVDTDFRVESDDSSTMFKVDAGNNQVSVTKALHGPGAFIVSNNSDNGTDVEAIITSLTSDSNNTNCFHMKSTTQGIASYGLRGDGSSTFTSDERLKTDIVDVEDGLLEKLNSVRFVNFKWKADPKSPVQMGVIAQELEKIFPDLVVEDDDAVGTGETYKSVSYGKLNLIAIKAIQEQQALIETLQTKVKALEEA